MTPRLQVDLTENGMAMLKNFLMDICSFSGDFTMEDRQKECIQYIKEMVGDNKVLVSVTVVTKRSFRPLLETSHYSFHFPCHRCYYQVAWIPPCAPLCSTRP